MFNPSQKPVQEHKRRRKTKDDVSTIAYSILLMTFAAFQGND